MTISQHLFSILGLMLLCAGWVGVQLLARRLGTKNHMEHGGGNCGQCGCGDVCTRGDLQRSPHSG